MKISLSSLKRTNLAHPSEWEGLGEEGEVIKISYRCGEIKIFVSGTLHITTEKNELDIGGYMEDEELRKILIRDEIASD